MWWSTFDGFPFQAWILKANTFPRSEPAQFVRIICRSFVGADPFMSRLMYKLQLRFGISRQAVLCMYTTKGKYASFDISNLSFKLWFLGWNNCRSNGFTCTKNLGTSGSKLIYTHTHTKKLPNVKHTRTHRHNSAQLPITSLSWFQNNIYQMICLFVFFFIFNFVFLPVHLSHISLYLITHWECCS